MDIMLSVFKLIAVMALTLWVTWIFYLAVMHLKEERDRLKAEGKEFTTSQKIFGYPIIFIGLIVDVFLNMTAGTILFIEIPKEILFTGRVSRWNDTGGWRGDLARWFCSTLLDPFEKGGHCS